MLQRILQITLLLLLAGTFSAKVFADAGCQLTRNQAASIERWELQAGKNTLVPLYKGQNVFLLQCDLAADGALTFQRPGLISHQLDVAGEIGMTITAGQIAYAIPQGPFDATLKLQAEHAYTPRFKWQSQDDFLISSQQHSLIMGGFYGLGFTLMLLSFLVGWKIKAPALKLYGFYIACLTAFLVLQEGQLFIIFGNRIATAHQFAYIISIGLTVFSASWFFSNFLYIKQDFPVLTA